MVVFLLTPPPSLPTPDHVNENNITRPVGVKYLKLSIKHGISMEYWAMLPCSPRAKQDLRIFCKPVKVTATRLLDQGQLRSLSGRAAGREHGDTEIPRQPRRYGDLEIRRYGDTATLRMRLVPLVLALMAASCWGEERLLAGPLPSLIDTIDSLGGSTVSVDSQ